MMSFIFVCVIAISFLFTASSGAHRGEQCMGTAMCYDTGLVCTGGKCMCYTDLSEDIARYWACNTDNDCPPVNTAGLETDVDASVTFDRDFEREELKLGEGKQLKCIPSTECPLVDGFSGYCNVERENAQL